MIPWCLLGLLLLWGCHSAPTDWDRVYQQTQGLYQRGNFRSALAEVDAQLQKLRAPSGPAWYWRFLFLKVDILLAQRRPNEALQLLDSQFSEGIALHLQARIPLLRARAYLILREHLKAERLLRKAQGFASTREQRQLLGESLLVQGSLALEANEYAAAEDCFLKSLSVARQEGKTHWEMMALGNLGYAALDDVRFDEAIHWFNQALRISSQLGDSNGTGKIHGNLGWCYFRLGDWEKALQLSRKAVELQSDNPSDQQIWLATIGSVHFRQKDFEAAISYYSQALEIAEQLPRSEGRWVVKWLNNLAETMIQLKNFDEAERYNQRALALQPKAGDEQSRLWQIISAAQITAARQHFSEAERLYREVIQSSDNAFLLIEAEALLGRLFLATGQIHQAEVQFARTIQVGDKFRERLSDESRITYLSSLIGFYQDFVEFLMSQDETERALEVADSSRARVLAEGMLSLNTQSALEVRSLQRLAKRGNAIFFSYWLAPRRSFLWVVSKRGVRSFVLPPAERIESLVRSYRVLIEELGDPLVSAHPVGRQLYQVLLAPAKEYLREGSNLVVVADGSLHGLNFETLPLDGEQSRYLIEAVRISVTPSLAILRQPPGRLPSPSKTLLLIGDPISPGPEFPPLPYAAKEIESIQQHFPAQRTTVYSGLQANPGIYRESRPEEFWGIHFAAHSVANPESPLNSAVILSRKSDVFKLYAREVAAIPLRAELVTLSACRTAGARAYSGEGLVGFAWAFLQAGARNVIAGLWDVNDRSTFQLMERLYSHLATGQSPAEALRQAKLSLIRASGNFRKPYYWAPFQIYSRSQVGSRAAPVAPSSKRPG